MRLVTLAPLAAALFATGCTDSTKVSENEAAKNVEHVAAQVDKDVKEIREGLPSGAKKLHDNLFAKDAKEIVPTVARSALKKTREQVTVLQLAKSTFFTVVDPSGTALGSDQETDAIAGKNVLAGLPGLEKAKTSDYVETTGELAEARGARSGDDGIWAAAAPVKSPDGKLEALYVTGWSFRGFAYHLEAQLKSDLRQELSKKENAKMPLVYVFVLKDGKAYGAPVTPEVSQKGVESAAPLAKTQGDAVWHGKVEITGHEFGLAAKRTPNLCADCGVAVLRSEL